MSTEDFSVSPPTEEPHRLFTSQPPQQEPTAPTNTTLPSYMHSPHQNPLYTKLPLPPVPKESIRLLWNNTNALQIEEEHILAKSIDNYLKHDPTILGLIETKRNFRLHDKTTKPLRAMVQARLQKPAKIKMVTGSCYEEHTARNLKEPGGVCQLMLGRILSLHKSSGSDDLGRWVWQQVRIDGARKLYIITAYRVCPKPTNSTKMTTAWHQQYRGLLRKKIRNPDPRQRFMLDLGRFLTEIRNNGADYILGWDANTPHDHDDIQDFLQDNDMVDAFSDFFDERPATYFRGSDQIDLISISRRLAPYVQKAYILAPSDSEGDHSTIGIDFEFGALTSNADLSDIDPGHMENRVLVSTDVKASTQYLTLVKKKNSSHNVTHRINVLYERCGRTGRCTDEDRRLYQNICRDLYTNAKQAEAECKRVGGYSWSRMMAAVGRMVQYANEEFRRAKNHRPGEVGETNDAAFARAKQNRTDAYSELHRVQARSEEIRETDLQLQATEQAERQNTTQANALKAILKRERQASIYPQLRHWINGASNGAIDELWMPDDPLDLKNTTWTALVERQAIFEALIKNGEEHFSQASNTPFASGPIAEHLGPYDFNEYSQQILRGEFDIDSITDNIQLRAIVKALSHSDPTNPISPDSELTIEKLKEGFSFIKESTSSNAECLHHGHWKTLIKDDEAFEPYAVMIMFAFKFGEPPDAWTNSHQVMLGKDDIGEPIKITRIRRIQLVSAAMNMGCRIIWGHEMLKRATRHGLISPYQFGGINGRMSISCVLLKRTSYDIIRLMRLTALIFDNDATAAYDRMIPSQCMIVSARAGVPEGAIQMKLTALKRMKYFVKTAYGTSTNHFAATFLRVVLGMLQGSSEVCPIWTLNSSIQFDVLDKQFQPAIFPSPRPAIFTARNGEAFIDDTTLWETSSTATLEELTMVMMEKAQAWERTCDGLGGALNLLKTYFYAIGWKYRKNGQPVMRTKADDPDIAIRLTQGADRDTTVPIKRIEVNEGKRTLGARLAPVGSDTTEYQYRLNEAIKLRPRLLRAPLGRESTRLAFTTMILQKFSYPLGATCFSESECGSIQAKLFPTILSKMGINRSTPQAVRSGPTLYGGMGVPEFWPIQGSTKNKLLISHLRKSDLVGNNISVELDCLQLQAGTSWRVLSREGKLVRSYIDKCWASQLWEFNDTCGLTIQQEDKAWLLPQREHDQFIMEALTDLPQATTARLRGSQCCRLFLQVTTLADVTNSAGTHLSDWVTNQKYAQSLPRQANLKYPNQGRPSSTVWNEFVTLLQQAFTEGTNNKLRQRLGNWYRGRISQAWNQVYSPSDNRIYSFETEPRHSVRMYEQSTRRNRRWRYLRSTPTLSFPIDAVPISGKFEAGFFIPDNHEGTGDVVPPPPDDVLQWEDRMLQGRRRYRTYRDIADAIWSGDAIIGTDGSASNDNGTYSFVILINIANESPTVAFKSGGNLPALADHIEMDSHRPEAAALYAALCFVRLLLTKYPRGPTTGLIPHLHFVLDNKSVAEDDLKWEFGDSTSVFDYLKSDYDLLQGIQREIRNLPIASKVSWVKGHQDRHKPRSELSLEALANCIADDVCTETHHRHPSEVGRLPDWIPGTKAALLHHGKLVSKKQDAYVHIASTAPRLRERLIQKSQRHDPFITDDWDDATFDDIDWQSVRASLESKTKGEHYQLSKFINNWTPTLHHRATQDNSIDRRCFECGAWRETIDHVLQCPGECRAEARDKAKAIFLKHLSQYHTPAPMANVIMSAIDRWFSGLQPALVPRLPTGPDDPNQQLHKLINEAFVHQSNIGWGHFLRGRVSLHWKTCIAEYYKIRQPGEPYNPNLWMRKTVDAIWQIFLKIWITRNGELYGKNYEEQRAIALETTRAEVSRIYEDAKHFDINDAESRMLHGRPLEQILNWTKTHLDAYLATAEVILEQNVDPG